MQNATFVSGVQPHTLGLEAPPHVSPAPVQPPQLAIFRIMPQLSSELFGPQLAPVRVHSCASDSGVQPHTLAFPPPPHVEPVPLHVPQLATARERPQLSFPLALPQLTPERLQNAGVGSGVHPHTLALPAPPHVSPGPLHVPQLATVRIMPQLSSVLLGPQVAPPRAHS